MNKEIEIPEGYEARIEGNKVILESKESEDERIGEELLRWLKLKLSNPKIGFVYEKMKQWIAYLEKQKAKEKYDRLAPIYSDQQSFEDALEKAWKFYNDSGSRTVDGLEDNSIELSFAKGFREGFLCKEKQKEQDKCPEYCVRSNCIGCSIYEKQKEQKLTECTSDSVLQKIKIAITHCKELSEHYKDTEENFHQYYGGKAEGLQLALACFGNKNELAEQNPAEWNEKDKQTIRDAINRIEQLDHYWNRPTDEKLIKRLKSLRPQPNTVLIKDATKFGNLEYERGVKDGLNHHWKPSEEQMKALKRFIGPSPTGIILGDLYDKLEKLK